MSRPASLDDPYGMTIVPTCHTDTYPFIDPEKGDASEVNVLVSGASKGIGRATALSFARAGALAIALIARSGLDDVAKQIREAAKQAGRKEPRILKLPADICDDVAVEKAFKLVEQEFGSLDIVINNASRLETWIPLADSDVKDWWRTWELNIKGTYLVTRAALPLVLKSRLKTIVTVTSAGAFVSTPGASAYQATKTTQIRFNDFLEAEYADKGLLAYTVHPGGVATETGLNMPEDYHFYLTQTAELSADTMVWLTRERKTWLSGRFVFGPLDMEEFSKLKDDIVEKDMLKIKLTV